MGYRFSLSDTVSVTPELDVARDPVVSEEVLPDFSSFFETRDEEFIVNSFYETRDDTLAERESIIDTINADPLLYDTIQTNLNELYIPSQLDFIIDVEERKKLYKTIDLDTFLFDDPASANIIKDSLNASEEKIAHLEPWVREEYREIANKSYADPNLQKTHLNELLVHGRILKSTEEGDYGESGAFPGMSFDWLDEIFGIPLGYVPTDIVGENDLINFMPNVFPDEREQAEGISSWDKFLENPTGYIGNVGKAIALGGAGYGIATDKLSLPYLYYDPTKKGRNKFTRLTGPPGQKRPNLLKDVLKGGLKVKTGSYLVQNPLTKKLWNIFKSGKWKGPGDPPISGMAGGMGEMVDAKISGDAVQKADNKKKKTSKMVLNNLVQQIQQNVAPNITPDAFIQNLIMTSMNVGKTIAPVTSPNLTSPNPSNAWRYAVRGGQTVPKVSKPSYEFPRLRWPSFGRSSSGGGGGGGGGGGVSGVAKGFNPRQLVFSGSPY